VDDCQVPVCLLPGIDLSNFLHDSPADETVDLLEIPARRLDVSSIDIRSTLEDARKLFQNESAEALCVFGWSPRGDRQLRGILTKEYFNKVYTL
jgi:hypothetical protein